MNDRTKQYLRLAERNMGRIVMGIMFLMLVGLGYTIYMEQGSTGEVAGTGTAANLKDPVPENPNFKRVMAMAAPIDLTSYPQIQQVAQYNMFDYKSVRDKQEIERGADQKFIQAQTAAAAGQTDEAKRLLNEILKQVPTHKKARDLLDKLSTGGKAEASPTPKP